MIASPSGVSSVVDSSEPAQEPAEGEEQSPGHAIVSEVISQAADSNRSCEQLDGTLHGRSAQELYGPNRRHLGARWSPYQGGATVAAEEDEDEETAGREEDLWVYDDKRQPVIPHHVNERAVKFTPSNVRGCPIPLKCLSSKRRTVKVSPEGHMQIEDGNWRQEREPSRWWTNGEWLMAQSGAKFTPLEQWRS